MTDQVSTQDNASLGVSATKDSPPAVSRSDTPLIVARNLGLKVPVFLPQERKLMTNPIRLVADLYLSRSRRTFATLLENVDLRLEPGERLGLIGPNGAGKSTLLKVLAGIYPPTEGVLEVNGEATGLFGIGLGMLQEATGLENIYMRGLQMGLTLGEIREMVPKIVEFAELPDAIEKPLNTYSSGMNMRLTVAISTMIKPDILLLDEWIGAGDAHFRAKFQDRMMEVVENSRGLVLATHSVRLMAALCTRAVVVHKGSIVFSGPVHDAQAYYMEHAKNRV